MTRLPRVTADETMRKLLRAGFRAVRSSGSHIRLRNDDGRSTTVPRHAGKTIKPKTLATILEQAGITIEQFTLL